MAVALSRLADLRRRGLKPESPVVLTDDRRVIARKRGDGALVELVDPAHPEELPLELLAGLDVRLAFRRCELAAGFWRRMNELGVTLRSGKAWCHCRSAATILAEPCRHA